MYYLQYLLLLLLGLPMLPSISEADDKNFSNCAPIEFSCGGHSQDIYYPFRLPDSPDYCGHPGFELTCSGGGVNSTLITKLGGKEYQVKSINYPSQILEVVDPNFSGQSCPQTFTNTTLDLPLVNYGFLGLYLTVYFNCSPITLPPNLYDIACLTNITRYHSYYSLPEENPSPPLDLLEKCSSIAQIPIYKTFGDLLRNGSTKDFLDALEKGFDLIWTVGMGWCNECMDSGGICGYDPNSPDAETCLGCNATTNRDSVTGSGGVEEVADANDGMGGSGLDAQAEDHGGFHQINNPMGHDQLEIVL